MSEEKKVLDRRLLVILLVVFVQIVGASMVLPILPLYATTNFGMSPGAVTLLITVFFAAQFAAGPTIGRLSDRYGRVPVLIVSQVGTVISFLLLGFATSVPMLFFARTLDGITGGNIVVAQAYVTDVVPREKRTQALGYIFLAFGVGFIVGPALGGIISSFSGNYATPYVLAAIAAAVVVVLTVFFLDESVSPEQRVINREVGKAYQLSLREIGRNQPLVLILFMTFGAQFAFSLLQSTFALYGQDVLFLGYDRQATDLGIGLLLSMAGVGQIVTQGFVLKRLVTRFGDGMLVIIGTITRGLGMGAIAFIVTPYPAAVALFFYAMGTGILMPGLQSLATTTVRDEFRGNVLGVYQSSISLSVIFGSAIAGTLFSIAPAFPYLLGGLIFALMLIPGVYILRWYRGQQTPTPDESGLDAQASLPVKPVGDPGV